MVAPAKFPCSKPTFHLQINLQRRSLKKLSFPLFSRELSKSTPVRFPVIRASSSSPSNPKPSLFKTTCITLTAAAALCSASFYLVSKPTATIPVAIAAEEATPEKHLKTKSNDVEALLSLTKIKFEADEHDQAREILNRMIEIDPGELEWPLMKARILAYDMDSESTIKAFEEILAKEPLSVEAYHHLVMEFWDSSPKLTELETRIREAIRRCEKEKKTKGIRDFRLLIAQIKVFEGNSLEALGICEELVKDDPEDPRLYLFQGFVYSLMKKDHEAAKQFKQFASLLPEDHPYKENATNRKISGWRVIVAYDSLLCYSFTFSKLVIGYLLSSIQRIHSLG